MEFFGEQRGPERPRENQERHDAELPTPPGAPPASPLALLNALVTSLKERAAGSAKAILKSITLRTNMWLMVPLCLAGAMLAGFASLLVYYTVVFPNPLEARQKEPSPVVRILARDGSVLAERGTAHDYMPLSLLPPRVIAAVVATEDRRFYTHWGVDPSGMVRAMFANLRAGRFAQGGSTLTQQLAKNMFLTSERTLSRKLEEFALAVWLEIRLSKEDILELYLNRVYFGAGAYGIESAAQRYFNKSARELNLAEAAVIAGLLKAPSKYAPSSSPEQALIRGRSVLNKMLDAGAITADEHRRAGLDKVRFSQTKRTREDTGIDYAVDFVLERLPPLAGSGHAEIVVETTIDAGLQKRASEIVAAELGKNGAALAVSQAAVVVLDLEGGIRALVGGKSYAESQYNRAVKAQRQPGSAFKPVLYLSAIEAGYTPDSLVYDTPMTIGGWTPRNDGGKYVGAVTLRHALALSINSVAARLYSELGPRSLIATARRLGISSDLRPDPSLALGTSEVTLLEMTGAYGVFANSGRSIEPHCIRRVRMSSGRVLFARDAQGDTQVVAPADVAAMNDMLRAGMNWGTGRRASLAGHMAGGKTGTTQDFRDAWFVGFTSHLAAGVWAGNDQGQPMNKVMGGNLPATIWQQIMTAAHQGKAPLALPGVDELAPRAPRGEQLSAAGNGFEDLPWLRETKPAAQTLSPAAAPRASHPAEPIDPALFEKALSGVVSGSGTLATSDQVIPASKAGPRAPVVANQRIVVRPPGDMMFLGGPAAN